MAKDMANEEEIGKVVHFYDKIMVAVVALKRSLKVGDTIHLVGKDNDFTQEVSSMQIEHEPVKNAKKETEVAIKVNQPVKKNWRVYKSS